MHTKDTAEVSRADGRADDRKTCNFTVVILTNTTLALGHVAQMFKLLD